MHLENNIGMRIASNLGDSLIGRSKVSISKKSEQLYIRIHNNFGEYNSNSIDKLVWNNVQGFLWARDYLRFFL